MLQGSNTFWFIMIVTLRDAGIEDGLDAGSTDDRTTAPLALDPGAYTPPSRLDKLMAIGGREVAQWRV